MKLEYLGNTYMDGAEISGTIKGIKTKGLLRITRPNQFYFCQNAVSGANSVDAFGYNYSWSFNQHSDGTLTDEVFLDPIQYPSTDFKKEAFNISYNLTNIDGINKLVDLSVTYDGRINLKIKGILLPHRDMIITNVDLQSVYSWNTLQEVARAIIIRSILNHLNYNIKAVTIIAWADNKSFKHTFLEQTLNFYRVYAVENRHLLTYR